MLLKIEKAYFIPDIIKEVESREARKYWTLMKKSEVKNKYKNQDGELKTILSIWYFKRNRLIDVRLMKHKARLFAHGVMQQ